MNYRQKQDAAPTIWDNTEIPKDDDNRLYSEVDNIGKSIEHTDSTDKRVYTNISDIKVGISGNISYLIKIIITLNFNGLSCKLNLFLTLPVVYVLKVLSAYNIFCIYFYALQTSFITGANSMNPRNLYEIQLLHEHI